MRSRSVLVLDVDATLVNVFGTRNNWFEVEGETREEPVRRLFSIETPEHDYMWGVKRPHVDTFIKVSFETFDCVGIWSAGAYSYVHEIATELFKNAPRSPDFIWTKTDCVPYYKVEDGTYIKTKPLEKLWSRYKHFDPKRTILLDDNMDVCAQNPLNHVLVPHWEGGLDCLHKHDDVLKTLTSWFQREVSGAHDFRRLRHPQFKRL